MYLTNWADIQQWMQDNSIKRWVISRTQEKQDNNNVFVYDKDKNEAENLLICERALKRFSGDVLYLTGWRTMDSKTGGFSATICYDRPQEARRQEPAAGLGAIDIETIKSDIRREVQNEFDKERLNIERKELEQLKKSLQDERKEFERKQDGVIGALVHYFTPVVQQLAGKLAPTLQKGTVLAGLDANEDIEVAKIKAQEQNEEAENPFTDEEAEEMLSLMIQFQKAEPDNWLILLRKMVQLAKENDKTYQMAKSVLLQ